MTAKKQRPFKVGDSVTIKRVPAGLTDSAGIGTPGVFKRALGKTFRVAGIVEHGHLELEVTRRDTIWIEPEFVVRSARRRKPR
jgi:hypothetical protein